ncbi:aromatic acid exporter family protein [Hathewaya histolytica]|uniref:Putative transmembrane protein n=1 Tax=Hathewaya histolytica TaxID=1498 RepID=A0A4U9RT20_HATHI|nr:aromatic acid exporter family protein [Hathewaya histolytica]VTQ92170.1 putative transmembrane protein [Hathewaya histolytica]
MKKIGMRNIKTSLAVFISIMVLKLFKVSFPFYACIAAIITMEKTIYNSFKVGKNRIIGTTLGAIVGLLFVLILPGNTFLVAIGISVTIYLCDILGYNKSISIACIVFIAISSNLKGGNPFVYSGNRLLETFVGIIVAVIVNLIIYPPNLKKHIYDSSNRIHKDLILLCGEDFYNNNEERLQILYKHIKGLEESISSYEDEYRTYDKNLNLQKYEKAIDLFYKLYSHLNIIEHIKNNFKIPKETYDSIKDLITIPYKNIENEEDKELQIVFKYHMNQISKILHSLDEINML